MRPVYFYAILFSMAALSCVPSGKFKAMQKQEQQYDSLYTWSMHTLKACQDTNNDLSRQKSRLQAQTNDMNMQLTATRENNTVLRKQLQELSSLSASQAESIRKSMDNIGANIQYEQALHIALVRRDSANLAVLMNLKTAMGSFGDSNASIKIDNGVVHLDLSDQLLFDADSTGYTVSSRGRTALARLAHALNDQPGVQFMVETYTDSSTDPRDSLLATSWDLSAKRAVSLVRILQIDYHVAPERMTAAGRGEYIPIATNDTPEGRADNRRTRIIITPDLDELMKLLEHRTVS